MKINKKITSIIFIGIVVLVFVLLVLTWREIESPEYKKAVSELLTNQKIEFKYGDVRWYFLKGVKRTGFDQNNILIYRFFVVGENEMGGVHVQIERSDEEFISKVYLH